MPLLAVALPALHFLEKFMAMPDALDGDGRLGRYLDRLARFFGLPPLRESLDVGNEIVPVLVAQRTPRRHIAGLDTAHQCVDQVGVEGQGAGGCGTAFEGGDGEVSWLRIDERRSVTVAVAIDAMAEHAIAQVEAVSGPLGGTEAVAGRGIAGADARILGKHTAPECGSEQN